MGGEVEDVDVGEQGGDQAGGGGHQQPPCQDPVGGRGGSGFEGLGRRVHPSGVVRQQLGREG